MSGRLPQQCQERYRLAHVVVELTFVFLRVILRDSPLLRSSHVLTKDTDTVVSTRPISLFTHTHHHPHTPRYHMYTGSWVFFATKTAF